MKSKKRWFVTALTACLTLSLGICAEALEYDFDGVEDTEYYPSTSYESLYGAKYNYGGSNATDYQWPALPYRTLPLVPEYRRLLLQMKKHQEEYRELCGNCYHESDYIYVNDLGEPIRPNYVSQHFKIVLKNNNLREITFHELRHTCASLLLKSGISMKDIQAWLGHSNYNTTANIYAHLESSSKEITGNAMQDNFTISANLAAREAVQA